MEDQEEISIQRMGNREEYIKKYIQDLPKHVLDKIITKLPLEKIIKLRELCQNWNKLTTTSKFVADSFLHSRPSLLLQITIRRNFKSKLLDLDDTRLGYKLKNFNMFRMGKARSTCNGLLLVKNVNDLDNERTLLVMNMLTKCSITLPRCPSFCPHQACGLALVFNPHEKNYKVIHIYVDGFGFEVFTLGNSENQWKVIPGPFYDEPYDRPFGKTFRWSDPVCTNEQLVLHWKVESDEFIISMDTLEETSRRTFLPLCIDKERYSLLEIKGNLSLMSNVSTTQFDVWILKDFHNQVWFKSYSILADSISYLSSRLSTSSMDNKKALPDLEKLVPVVSVRDGEILVLKHKSNGCWYLYETKLKELKKFCDMRGNKDNKLLIYKSSLVYWENNEELLARETI